MTTIADTFTRADSTTSLGSSSEGWSWTALAGVFGINSNQVYHPTNVGNDGVRAEINLDTDAHFSQIQILQFSSIINGGACTRFSASATTFYNFLWRSASTQYQLFKCVAGTFTQLGTGGATSAGGDVVRLESNNANQHTGYRNGVVNMSAVTDTSITGNTRTGFMLNGGISVRYDNFSAGDLVLTKLLPFPWDNTSGGMQNMTGGMRG